MDPASPAQPQPERELLKWSAVSRPYKPLDRQLFATGVIIAVLVSIISALAGEWMLIAVIVAMIFAYYMWSTVPPESTEYVITTRGMRIHGQLYLWQELTRWWIEDKWGHKMLLVDAPLSFPKRIHLVLGEIDAQKLEEIMGKYLLMEKPLETSMDKAGRWLADKFPLSTR
jgi:hypothetical protein